MKKFIRQLTQIVMLTEPIASCAPSEASLAKEEAGADSQYWNDRAKFVFDNAVMGDFFTVTVYEEPPLTI